MDDLLIRECVAAMKRAEHWSDFWDDNDASYLVRAVAPIIARRCAEIARENAKGFRQHRDHAAQAEGCETVAAAIEKEMGATSA